MMRQLCQILKMVDQSNRVCKKGSKIYVFINLTECDIKGSFLREQFSVYIVDKYNYLYIYILLSREY